MNKLPFNVGDLVSIGWNYTYYDAQEVLIGLAGAALGGGMIGALIYKLKND